MKVIGQKSIAWLKAVLLLTGDRAGPCWSLRTTHSSPVRKRSWSSRSRLSTASTNTCPSCRHFLSDKIRHFPFPLCMSGGSCVHQQGSGRTRFTPWPTRFTHKISHHRGPWGHIPRTPTLGALEERVPETFLGTDSVLAAQETGVRVVLSKSNREPVVVWKGCWVPQFNSE